MDDLPMDLQLKIYKYIHDINMATIFTELASRLDCESWIELYPYKYKVSHIYDDMCEIAYIKCPNERMLLVIFYKDDHTHTDMTWSLFEICICDTQSFAMIHKVYHNHKVRVWDHDLNLTDDNNDEELSHTQRYKEDMESIKKVKDILIKSIMMKNVHVVMNHDYINNKFSYRSLLRSRGYYKPMLICRRTKRLGFRDPGFIANRFKELLLHLNQDILAHSLCDVIIE
jgi:hypothetical protein